MRRRPGAEGYRGSRVRDLKKDVVRSPDRSGKLGFVAIEKIERPRFSFRNYAKGRLVRDALGRIHPTRDRVALR